MTGMARKMKEEETLAQRFLSHLGYQEIVYEPLGPSTAPDFLVDGRIAVEVRRLNHNLESSTGYEGRENVEMARIYALQAFLKSFGKPVDGHSWFVLYKITKSNGELERHWKEHWQKNQRIARQTLERFINSQNHDSRIFYIRGDFELEILPVGKVYDSIFVLGYVIDDNDEAVLLTDELEKNLRICIKEKGKIIANVGSQFSEWWLVLVDRIGFTSERDLFQHQPFPAHSWDRIILINPLDHRSWFALEARPNIDQSASQMTNSNW